MIDMDRVRLAHWVNQGKIEEWYGIFWERHVHWSELPEFLREDALYMFPRAVWWIGDPSVPTRPFTADDMEVE